MTSGAFANKTINITANFVNNFLIFKMKNS